MINPPDESPPLTVGDFPTPVMQPVISGLSADGVKELGAIVAHPGSIRCGEPSSLLAHLAGTAGRFDVEGGRRLCTL